MFKVWNKSDLANTSQKKAGLAILTVDKINFQIKGIIRNKKGLSHYGKTINSPGRQSNFKFQ